MNLLIADSGSTKTDWILTDGKRASAPFQTSGINPRLEESGVIADKLRRELLPLLPEGRRIDKLFFYGAGCRGEAAAQLQAAFSASGLRLSDGAFFSDLLGAARALCGDREGIACILGTGSNCGLYDGESIIRNIVPMGYIMGDDGSGASIGKRLLNTIYKEKCSDGLLQIFRREYPQENLETALRRIYKQPFPNRYLASFAPFCHRHRQEPEIREMILEEFRNFIRENLLPFRLPSLPAHFVGSIAACFQEELQTAFGEFGLPLGRVFKSPLSGLSAYHLSHLE